MTWQTPKTNWAAGNVPEPTDFNRMELNANVLRHPPISEQTATSYTLALGDNNSWIEMNSATAQTLVVPSNATAPFPLGTEIIMVQKGAAVVTISPASGVTLQSHQNAFRTGGQNAVAGIKKVGSDLWYCFGNLEV